MREIEPVEKAPIQTVAVKLEQETEEDFSHLVVGLSGEDLNSLVEEIEDLQFPEVQVTNWKKIALYSGVALGIGVATIAAAYRYKHGASALELNTRNSLATSYFSTMERLRNWRMSTIKRSSDVEATMKPSLYARGMERLHSLNLGKKPVIAPATANVPITPAGGNTAPTTTSVITPVVADQQAAIDGIAVNEVWNAISKFGTIAIDYMHIYATHKIADPLFRNG